MPTVTKRRRATKRPAEPPATPPVNLEPHGIEIYPELMEFADDCKNYFRPGDPKPYTVDIREATIFKENVGRRLFTMTIDPLLNAASASRIVALIVSAPNLWRTVRNDYAVKFSNSDAQPDDFADFAYVHKMLYESAGYRQPYEEPANHTDEKIYRHEMERDRQLADPAWREAMVSKFIRIEDRSDAKSFGAAFHCNVIPTCTFCSLLPDEMAAHLRDKHGVQIDAPARTVASEI
jgi:hypothetical protein